ncbi:MAG: ATP-binding protein [Polyangiales bacterium]|nr:hypothetical protein [Myxococcales bacterium]
MTERTSAPSALPAAPTVTFEEWSRDTLRRRVEVAGVAITLILAVAWVVGRVVLAGTPKNAPGKFWIPIQIGIALSSVLAMRYLPLSRRHPIWVACAFSITMAASVALHLGALGGFDGPYFYAVYIIAPLTLILPCELKERLVLTVAPTLAFVLTFALAYPSYFPYPMIHIPTITLLAVVGVSAWLGHSTHELTRERHDLAAELARRAQQEARELERRALARVLHDDLAQVTTAARMELECLARAASDAVPRDDFNHLGGLLDALDRSSKRIVGGLREPRDDDALPARIERMCTVLERGAEVRIERSVDAGPVPARQQEVVYRVVQEALTNALKHARARLLRVAVRHERDALLVTVADDGRGFDVNARGAGWGLIGMRERVEGLGGTLRFDSGAGGTALTARVPLATVQHE